MTLVVKIIAFLAIWIFSVGTTSSTLNECQFVYLNKPETLKTTGILHKKKYSQNTNVRYFFHYVNGTKENQIFTIKSNSDIFNLKFGCDIDPRPELAGSKSVKKFMTSKNENSKINFTRNLKPSQTISGIFEGIVTKNDEIKFNFGENEKIIAKDFYQNKFQHDIVFDLKMNDKSKFRLGDAIKDTVSGQYGNDINLIINPKESGILKLSFSPRGGEGLLVFNNRGKIYTTEIKSAYKEYEAILVYVEKGKQEKFQFIPVGGFNYPIELNFSLQSEILREAIG